MDLPPCPVCGGSLDLESPRGTAKCAECGYTGPAEVDREALGNLLDDASQRGLGPRTMLAASSEAPEPRLEGRATPSMLDGPKAPELPQLAPPAPPPELVAGAPPPLADPREPMPETRDQVARTPLADTLEDRDKAKEKELRARGELLR
ncbi:MAG: hypothetical protein JSW25_00280 [Thermoplasmata archaeon]|nr:MAG: hypothetical protein JSW25_00280 [Thermoplasmata archaeon]